MPSVTEKLRDAGQSIWLDYLSRDLLDSGALAAMVEAREVTGVTSNPTIFEKAISSTDVYDADIRAIGEGGERDGYAAFVALATEDVRRACDVLRPVYEGSKGRDGFVSLEVPPGTEFDVEAVVSEARRLNGLVGRPNLMIKVPGTPEGVEALEELITAGVNVNQTLLFDIAVYEQSAAAYIRGLEARRAAGAPLSRVASVASFFVSRVDTAVDALLPPDSPLRGRVAVANARRAYKRFMEIFSGPDWDSLADAGAGVQKPLWASTGTKNPDYSDILYVSTLIAPETVNTLPEKTLRAALDRLEVRPTLVEGIPDAEEVLSALAVSGVELSAVTSRLLTEGLASFQRDFDTLLDRLRAALEAAPTGRGG
ncbi:MAG: transaldolase [Dehalococcoidia bacterium]